MLLRIASDSIPKALMSKLQPCAMRFLRHYQDSSEIAIGIAIAKTSISMFVLSVGEAYPNGSPCMMPCNTCGMC